MIGWLSLDMQEICALIAIAGMIIGAWRAEKGKAREEARRERNLDEIERKNDRLGDQVDGYLSQIASLEVRIRQVEGKLERA